MRRLLPALGALSVLLVWGAAAMNAPPALLPSPHEVLEAAWAARATLAQATWTTGTCAVAGLAVASTLGLLGGVLFLRSRWLEAAFYPYALLVQTLPIVAIAPLLVVWLGYGRPVAVAAAAIASFFPVLTAAHMGLRAASAAELELLSLYGASWFQTLWKLRLPAALPFLFTGLRTAGGLSVIGAIVGEFVGSNGQPPSLGFLVLRAARTAQTGQSFAAIACATALSVALFSLARAVERRAIGPWYGDPGR